MNIREELIKLADELDKKKMRHEANLVDKLLKKIAQAPAPPAPGAPSGPGDKDKATLQDEKKDIGSLIMRLPIDPAKASLQDVNRGVVGTLKQLAEVVADVEKAQPKLAPGLRNIKIRLQRALQ